jgi:tetratricopeptide (TPR) repeat protein
MLRSMGLALTLFLLMLIPPPGRTQSDTKKLFQDRPPEPKKSEPAPAATYKVYEMLRATQDAIRPPTPEQFRAWAGSAFALDKPALGRKILARPTNKPTDQIELAGDLVRRGLYEEAALLLDPMVSRQPDDERMLRLHVVCQLALGRPELASRSLMILQGLPGGAKPPLSQDVRFLQQLVALMQSGRMPGVDANPWGVEFLPKGSAEPSKNLVEDQAKKLPADAAERLGRLLEIAPMQPTMWALLGQVLTATNQHEDALECFHRAKALGYSVPVVTNYIQVLSRWERERKAAAVNSMVVGTNNSTAPPVADDSAPVALTESSARAVTTFGIGGVIVGLLIGLMVPKSSRPRSSR